MKTIFGGYTKKKVFIIFDLCGEILQTNSHKTFRASLRKSGKSPSHTKNFPALKPMYI